MWPFNRGWPLNGGPLNRGSTVVIICRHHTYPCGWLGADWVSQWSRDLSYLDSGPNHVKLSIHVKFGFFSKVIIL